MLDPVQAFAACSLMKIVALHHQIAFFNRSIYLSCAGLPWRGLRTISILEMRVAFSSAVKKGCKNSKAQSSELICEHNSGLNYRLPFDDRDEDPGNSKGRRRMGDEPPA
jgi:hypothetical protein